MLSRVTGKETNALNLEEKLTRWERCGTTAEAVCDGDEQET
jgi:hypothetical protein